MSKLKAIYDKNNILQSCKNICQLLQTHPNLREIYLHWNKITKNGGSLIFQSLIQNDVLKVLDISWNYIGSLQCADKICEFLKNNTSLVHLDLSNNQFDYKQTQLISEALNYNQTLIGFHFAGHYGEVDECGFLKVNQQNQKLQHPTIYRIQGIKANKLRKYQRYQYIPDQQCCWICDGWVENSFEWPHDDHPIFLHLEFEKFEGKYLSQNNQVRRMVPNQEFYYFFTVEDEQRIIKNQLNIETILEKTEKIKIQDQIVDMMIQQKNVKEFVQLVPIFDDYYRLLINILPREKQEIFIKPKIIQKKKWQLKNSIFKEWKKVTDDQIQNCFEFDWSNNKIYRIIKNQNDLQNVRNHFKQHYLEYLGMNHLIIKSTIIQILNFDRLI